MIGLVLLGAVFLWWVLQSDGPGYEEVAGGFFVNHYGVDVTYEDFRIVTRHGGNALVLFKCYKDDVLIAEDDSGVLHWMRWFLFLDQEERLWYYSSDAGTELWTPQEDGSYLMNHPHDHLELPDEIRQRLPSSILKYEERERSRPIAPSTAP